jgi:hypothetical protein
MRFHELLEAPIEDLTHVGDWSKGSSFRHEQDRKLLTNPKAIQKITTAWAKTPVPFNVYLVNNKEGLGAAGNQERGLVTKEWLDQNMPLTAPSIEVNPNAVNILFISNSGDERVPMTGWILAHRFGHAVSRFGFGGSYGGSSPRRQFYAFQEARDELIRVTSSILNDGFGFKMPHRDSTTALGPFDKLMVAFYEQIGTMRSARSGSIRNSYEFILELLAQYMLTGHIKFNPLPKQFSKGRTVHARFDGPDSDLVYYNDMLEDLAETLGDFFTNLMHDCTGKILVM